MVYFGRVLTLILLWLASLSAPLRSNGADYVLLLFILFYFFSSFVLRNYPTDSHQIFRNCVFWCSLNNPVVLKFFWRHLGWLRFFTITSKQWKIIQIWNKLELGECFLFISGEFHIEQFRDSWDPFAQLGDKICIFVRLLCIHFLANSKPIQPICTQLSGKLCILK